MATVLDRGLERDEPTEITVVGTRRRFPWGKIIAYVVLTLIAMFFIVPMLVVFATSFKYDVEVFTDRGLIPANPGIENYQQLLGAGSQFYRWFLNSVIVSTVGTIVTVVLTSLSAYAFARIDFPFKGPLFALLITTLLLPGVMFLVPQFKLFATFRLYDTLIALMLPGIASVFGVFFMRQFFLSIPVELEEAAYIDGANRLKTFFNVILPLTGPALATLSVITFLGFWNDYLWALIMCENNCTLPPGLQKLQGQYTANYGLIMAGAVVTAIPVLTIYVALQRFVIQSVTSSGVKG
jgi:multiple sugar transport system permease protein